MKKRVLALLLAVVMCLAMAAPALAAEAPTSGKCGENVTWTLNANGTLTISGTGKMEDYGTFSSIPWSNQRDNITAVVISNGVTSIGGWVFFGCTGLTSVTIPNSVTSIGKGAFAGCTGLTSVTIPNSVTSIGESAFNMCTNLTSVTIPNSVTSIEPAAFSLCTDLTAIQVDAGNKNYVSVDGVVFTAAKDQLVAYPGGKQGAYTIPSGVTSIGSSAFYGCTSLTSVTILNSVTSIGESAFFNCNSMTSVTIPNSVAGIAPTTFYGCTSLKDVYYGGTDAQWKAIIIWGNNEPLFNATMHYNSTGPDQPQQPTQPTTPTQPTLPDVEPIAPTGTAVPTPQTVKLNGKDLQVQYYAIKDEKGNSTNYVKIRDLADALNGTKAQFNVSWDGKISIIPNTAYQPVGGEGATPYSGSQTYKAVSDTPVSFDGKEVNLTSFQIIHEGKGYTYYKLRDLGQLLNFETRWDSSAGCIVIETDKPYTGN